MGNGQGGVREGGHLGKYIGFVGLGCFFHGKSPKSIREKTCVYVSDNVKDRGKRGQGMEVAKAREFKKGLVKWKIGIFVGENILPDTRRRMMERGD